MHYILYNIVYSIAVTTPSLKQPNCRSKAEGSFLGGLAGSCNMDGLVQCSVKGCMRLRMHLQLVEFKFSIDLMAGTLHLSMPAQVDLHGHLNDILVYS